MNVKVYSLTRDQVRELCPSCADKMQLARIKELKLSADDHGNLLPSDEVTIKLFAGFSQGMCDKFGPDEGLFTRCAKTMAGKVDDEKAFCAALHKFCTDKWPAEKKEHVIREEDGKFVLYDSKGEKVLGRHPTREKAEAQERVIQAAKTHAYEEEDMVGITREEMLAKHKKMHPDATDEELDDMVDAAMAKMKEHAVAGMKIMDRAEVFKKCPECAKKMAAREQDMPVDNGGHMQHICGKGGRALGGNGKPVTFTEDVGNEDDAAELLTYTNDIKGVEIFGAGTHNGDVYTEKDLDDICSAFKDLDFRPAVKIGHSKDKPGAPSYGWVVNLKRVGDKIQADLTDMHDSVVDAIRNKNYDRVSSEIYFNLKRGGKEFRRALKAVALLGAEVPAVAGLTPLHKMEFVTSGFEKVGLLEQELNVSSQALVDALAERVSGLVNLIKEYDMGKKNAEQIKTLKVQVDEFNKKMDEMKKKKGKLDDEEMMEDEEYKQLVAQAEEISDKIAELESVDDDDDGADVAELREKLVAAEAIAVESQKQIKELSERTARIEHDKRNLEIGERVRSCKIPAFREALSAVYAYALEHVAATVKVYTEKDGKKVSEEKTLAEVIDGVVTEINAQSEKLFKAMAFSGQVVREDGEVEEDAGKEVQRRVSEYRVKHPEVKQYEQAMTAVLKADAELAQRYRAQFGQEQQ